MRLAPFSRRERGLVLVSSLLLLIVVTIIALSMFRSFGVQERIAGSVREKHRALHAAESAAQYAESWLILNGGSPSSAVDCGDELLHANIGQGQICNLTTDLGTVSGHGPTVVPWQASGVDVGIDFLPAGTGAAMTLSETGGVNTYYAAPRFYITDLGTSASIGQGEVYKINAVGLGGSPDAVAVIESTFTVYTSSWDPSK